MYTNRMTTALTGDYYTVPTPVIVSRPYHSGQPDSPGMLPLAPSPLRPFVVPESGGGAAPLGGL